MADDIGKDSPATDPKASDVKAPGKTGPVKPPVLEGKAKVTETARVAEPPKTAEAPGPKRPEPASSAPPPPKPPTPPKPSERDENGTSPWLAGLVGGVIGLGAAYGLAALGVWPAPPAVQPQTDPRLAQFGSAIPELQTVTDTLQDELATLNTRISGIESDLDSQTAPAPADSDLTAQIAALGERIDAIDAAPDSETNGVSQENSQAIAALQTALDRLQQDAGSNAAKLASVETEIDALTESAGVDAMTQQGVIRLPLIFSGLENALANGRPFETELGALRQALPEANIPEALAARAGSGLPRPELVAQNLDNVIPDMLAGRPATAEGSWQDGAANWFRGVIAMRPTGDVEGDSPDAIIARLEAAMTRRDFVAAQAELDALPASMRNAVGAVSDDIASLAQAQQFIETLRAQVLAAENGA